ncbi:hypothetical protein SDC9_123215 [bioreactor metagenome]|uniref:Cytochrome c domain-containing protein n=1 Tax=bioreactor metagenome TaxID=1076179 RepID=A0A645CH54_9ZZZZ
METGAKVYVAVLAAFTEDGQMIPRRIRWEDGRLYDIERVLDVRPAASLKAGGQGVWGSIPMPPNAHIKDDDLKTLVQWILAGSK